MKHCPKCNQPFSDELQFCLTDGTALQNSISTENYSDAPTVWTSSFYSPPQVQNNSSNSNKWIYPILGILSGAVVVLGFLAFFKAPAVEKENNSVDVKQVNSNKAPTNQIAENNSLNRQAVNADNVKRDVTGAQDEPPPISAEVVQELLNRWLKAQNERNFAAYKSCYGEPFLGIKRTKNGGESRMSYVQWLGDRRKMLQNTVSVGVQNLDISIDGDTAIDRFIQQFQSVNYNDEGQKILRIKMFSDGAKIIYEEMKYAY